MRSKHRQNGSIAAEMGLVIPLMVIMLLGMIDMSRMHLAGRKAVNAAQAASDLVSQEVTVDNSKLDDIASAIRTIMEPFPASEVGFNVMSVEVDSDGNVSVGWRYTGGVLAGASGFPAAAGNLSERNGSVIAAIVSYSHAPLFGIFPPMTFTEVSLTKPRKVPVIPNLDEV